MTTRAFPTSAAVVLAAVLMLVTSGCRKVTQDQCDQLVEHFAELVVRERYSDAGPEKIAGERVRFESLEAKHANEFKNCTSEVQTREFQCAMKAQSSDALIKCLE